MGKHYDELKKIVEEGIITVSKSEKSLDLQKSLELTLENLKHIELYENPVELPDKLDMSEDCFYLLNSTHLQKSRMQGTALIKQHNPLAIENPDYVVILNELDDYKLQVITCKHSPDEMSERKSLFTIGTMKIAGYNQFALLLDNVQLDGVITNKKELTEDFFKPLVYPTYAEVLVKGFIEQATYLWLKGEGNLN